MLFTCQGILHGFCWWEAFPFRIQFHHQGNVLVGNLAGNHNFLLLCGRHRELSQRVLLLLCSDLWPSCYRLRFVLFKTKLLLIKELYQHQKLLFVGARFIFNIYGLRQQSITPFDRNCNFCQIDRVYFKFA